MGQYDRQAQSQRKHGPLPNSGAAKAPATPPLQRPQWRGQGYVKKQKPRQTTAVATKSTSTVQEQRLLIDLQQLILNIFRNTFLASKDFDSWKGTLHEVNEALLQRDLVKAFGSEEFKEGYALRWSPSRSLVYVNVLACLCDLRQDDHWVKQLLNLDLPSKPARVVCFGGGAAEVMALAGLVRHLLPSAAGKPQQSELETSNASQVETPLLYLHLIDTADWSSVISKLETGVETPPTLSQYASASARASNSAFLGPNGLNTTFHQVDILSLSSEDLKNTIGSEPLMITFFLTLNDLYTISIPKTTALLRKLDILAPQGSVLVVIDSIDASSSPGISNNQLKDSSDSPPPAYSMDWLLDRVLLAKPQKDNGETEEDKEKPRWEKLTEEKMKQHKLDETLAYPGSLENMRFQLHVFRRL
ncbi:Uu.00g083750.m01.CDS01 [Anthostomella pinea]|uniref:Uu.00g083750.m01.CDS01 n=1 Tax=Anthostomella pinea TaxID=933095 RepID=A0AAI8VLM7_9PEZI|nr:Uu.00g083750.m01.CDS01 [Anthostomella pinea]